MTNAAEIIITVGIVLFLGIGCLLAFLVLRSKGLLGANLLASPKEELKKAQTLLEDAVQPLEEAKDNIGEVKTKNREVQAITTKLAEIDELVQLKAELFIEKNKARKVAMQKEAEKPLIEAPDQQDMDKIQKLDDKITNIRERTIRTFQENDEFLKQVPGLRKKIKNKLGNIFKRRKKNGKTPKPTTNQWTAKAQRAIPDHILSDDDLFSPDFRNSRNSCSDDVTSDSLGLAPSITAEPIARDIVIPFPRLDELESEPKRIGFSNNTSTDHNSSSSEDCVRMETPL